MAQGEKDQVPAQSPQNENPANSLSPDSPFRAEYKLLTDFLVSVPKVTKFANNPVDQARKGGEVYSESRVPLAN